MFNKNIVVLRVRKGVPGIGRKLANFFNAYEVTCNYKPTVKVPDGAIILNYGRSEWPIWAEDAIARGCTFLNVPDAVANSVDKLKTLELLSTNNTPCLETTSSFEEAHSWLEEQQDVIVRHILNGKQGKGVELVKHTSSIEALPHAPLYTKFYDKTHEFRVHVFNGKVIDYVQKKRMGSKKLEERGLEQVDELARNHKRGWVFAHKDIIMDDTIKQLGIDTAKVLGLDYAGVDILAKVEDGVVLDAVVCESNSAPGMSSPTTFKAYTNAINSFIEERKGS